MKLRIAVAAGALLAAALPVLALPALVPTAQAAASRRAATVTNGCLTSVPEPEHHRAGEDLLLAVPPGRCRPRSTGSR